MASLAVETSGAQAVGAPGEEETVAALFAEGQNAINVKRSSNLFDDLSKRELTAEEQAIIDARVAHNKRMAELYERREAQRKVDAVKEVYAELTDDEAKQAIRLCGGDEEEAVRRLTEDTAFMRRITNIAFSAGGSNVYQVSKSNHNPQRGVKIDASSVFVGAFRGKPMARKVTAPEAVSMPASSAPPSAAAAAAAAAAASAAETSPAVLPAKISSAERKPSARKSTPSKAQQGSTTPRGANKAPKATAASSPASAAKGGKKGETSSPSSCENAVIAEAAALVLSISGPDGMKIDAIIRTIKENGISDGGDKRSFKAKVGAALRSDRRFEALESGSFVLSSQPGNERDECMEDAAPPPPAHTPSPPKKGIEELEVPRRARSDRASQDIGDEPTPKSGRKRTPRRQASLEAIMKDGPFRNDDGAEQKAGGANDVAADDGEETEDEQPPAKKRTPSKAAKGKGKAKAKDTSAASPPPPPPGSDAGPSSPPPDAKEEGADAAAGAAAAASPASGRKPRRAAANAATASLAAAAGAGAGGDKVLRKTHYGRVKKGSTKRAEILEVGKLVIRPGRGWWNNGYIFTDGFKSRTAFRSSVDTDQLTVHECTIFDNGKYAPKPTFRVIAADRPDEPLDAQSATGCWTAILKRINESIWTRIRAGENLPEPPKTAIAGPEYFGLNTPDAQDGIEALDTKFECTEYWEGREIRTEILNGALYTGGKAPTAGSSGSKPKAPKARSYGGSRKRRGRAGDSDDDDEMDEDEEHVVANRWAGVNRTARYRERYGDDAMVDADNPIPDHIDPITLEPVETPAMSPAGHVMGLATWKAVLSEKGHCPFTKEPLAVHSLVKLTKANIERYRHLIVKS